MHAPNPTAARQLENSVAELAENACALLLNRQSGKQSPSTDLRNEWAHHFRQRVLELSAAIAAGQPSLFTSQVRWSRQALQARSQDHIPLDQTLTSLRAALREQMPEDLAQDALIYIDQALSEQKQTLPVAQPSQLDPRHEKQRLALLYLQAALEGEAGQAMELVLEAIEAGLSPVSAITDVLLPAQSEVGHLWHLDHVTIAEEHLVTSTTQRLMALIADRAKPSPPRGRTAVAASVAGNAHDIGIRAIAYLLEMDGWRAIYLGSDVPRNALPTAIHFFNADIALLSVALSSQIPKLQHYLNAIHKHCEERVRILIGGNGLIDAPDAWRNMGADGYAPDAVSAIALADRLS